MNIHAIENDISTNQPICHFDSTTPSCGVSRLASQAVSRDGKRIWYLSRKPHLFEAWSHLASHTESRFDSLTKAALLPVLPVQSENSTFSLNREYFGFSGGLVEVAW